MDFTTTPRPELCVPTVKVLEVEQPSCGRGVAAAVVAAVADGLDHVDVMQAEVLLHPQRLRHEPVPDFGGGHNGSTGA